MDFSSLNEEDILEMFDETLCKQNSTLSWLDDAPCYSYCLGQIGTAWVNTDCYTYGGRYGVEGVQLITISSHHYVCRAWGTWYRTYNKGYGSSCYHNVRTGRICR